MVKKSTRRRGAKASRFPLTLWPHQQEALRRVTAYIAAFRQGETNGAGLVHMPTGTGKTGVIAVLSRCVQDVGGVICITPRLSLRDQLADDISVRFFERIGVSADALPKRIEALKGGETPPAPEHIADVVFVTTVQKLHSMARRNDTLYGTSQARCRPGHI